MKTGRYVRNFPLYILAPISGGKKPPFVFWLCQSNIVILPCSLSESVILLDKTDDRAVADWATSRVYQCKLKESRPSVSETGDMASSVNHFLERALLSCLFHLHENKQPLLKHSVCINKRSVTVAVYNYNLKCIENCIFCNDALCIS